MRKILQNRGLRFVFAANAVSMLGSGMNTAAVTWYILKATHTEVALGWLIVLQTLPAMLLMPFTGVLIDREDRRRLVMALDAGRGVIILGVAILAFLQRVQVWQLYAMNILVATGFWVFWPTITALIQELTPDSEFVHSNTFLLAGVQGGWLIAGAIVGFVYNHIGLGGVLLVDFCTYVVSFGCYLLVRKGRHVVQHLDQEPHPGAHSFKQYLHEMQEGFQFLLAKRSLVLLGIAWALYLAGMQTTSILSAPLSDRIFHAGALGYGWLNAGWAIGAFSSTFYTAAVIAALGSRKILAFGLALMSFAFTMAPFSQVLAVGALLYAIGGSARGVVGVGLSSNLMETVPARFMGRIQNAIFFAGTLFQITLSLLIGRVAHRNGLAYAYGIIGGMYFLAMIMAGLPASHDVVDSTPTLDAAMK